MSQEHVWYCRKPDRGNPKQSKELTAGNHVLQGEVCIKRGIFQGDSISPLLFILTLILLTLVLRKVKAGYNLGNGLPTIIHLLFMDDLSTSSLHLQADIDRLYFKRSVGGRGFMNVEDSVE